VRLYVASLLVDDAAQLAFHCFESVMDGFEQRRMRAVVHLFLPCHQLVPRSHGDIDADVIRISLLMRVVSLLDRHVAAVDVVAKFLKSRCIFKNEIVDLVRFFQTPVRDLNRQFHNQLDTNELPDVEGTKMFEHRAIRSAAGSETAK